MLDEHTRSHTTHSDTSISPQTTKRHTEQSFAVPARRQLGRGSGDTRRASDVGGGPARGESRLSRGHDLTLDSGYRRRRVEDHDIFQEIETDRGMGRVVGESASAMEDRNIGRHIARRRDQARVWFGPVVWLSGCLVVCPVVWLSVLFVVWLASRSEIQPRKDANQLSTASPTASHSLNTHHPRDPYPAPEPHPHKENKNTAKERKKERSLRTGIESFLVGFGSMAKDGLSPPIC
ncbi:hypothetical protein BGZ61DRAFT_454022 [Ilyonectria robusta]|uniref:uncharacterized protein n=1 Tax=Ilyonectria robusta TaxID=1079257 RepID=UPI001E8DECEB|nr:uncharacterized protein BGZ61DRAFT_454022 [Ilyonectria robusta]KAH8686995.1 hypothetical protein BGZ61DRAFT_454022 [Ilyonectria robusta]